jgi:hypothetical protein
MAVSTFLGVDVLQTATLQCFGKTVNIIVIAIVKRP